MPSNDPVKAYFDAWNSRNAGAVLETLTPGGTYSDPVGGRNLSGKAYADYVASLFTAFPDLRLELISAKEASNGMIAAPWLLFGTHKGPLGDMAPTGRAVVLPGCDFITLEGGKVKDVKGFFDPDCLIAQLR